jgi:hypothetical protein
MRKQTWTTEQEKQAPVGPAKSERASDSKPDMMMLDRDLVVRLAEEHRLRITIRPDGQIIGFRDDLTKLRSLIEAVCSTDKTEAGIP